MAIQENAVVINQQNDFKLEPFFHLSSDLFCIAGFDGYFKRINPAVSKLLEYTETELFERPVNEFIHPEDQLITEAHREKLRNNIPLLNYENRYITKSGKTVWLSWTSMPLYEQQLVYAIAKNITHKKKLEEERNKLLTYLSKDNQMLRELSYTTTHDLRSPLSNLLLIASLLDTSKIEDEETLELIEMMKSGTDSIKNTLNNYVDVLMQKDGFMPKLEEVDLNDCLTGVISSIGTLISDSKTQIEVDFSGLKSITFNKAYMESVFLNLITNSIKYAKPELHPEITITSRRIKSTEQIVFSDNGLGFDMENVKDKIFKLNQKFHNHPDSKGLGLYLVYNHISSMGGEISVESKINEGSRFVISFKH